MSLPRLLLVDESLRRRLAMTEALRHGHELELLPVGEGAIRAVRRGRFALVLLCVEPDLEDALRQARAMRADFSPPPIVGLLDPEARLRDPGGLLQPGQAQGLYQGEIEAPRLGAWVSDLLGGGGGLSGGAPRPGLLRRLWGRGRGEA